MASILVARNTFWEAEMADELAGRPRSFSDSIMELASCIVDFPDSQAKNAEEECNSERSLSTAEALCATPRDHDIQAKLGDRSPASDVAKDPQGEPAWGSDSSPTSQQRASNPPDMEDERRDDAVELDGTSVAGVEPQHLEDPEAADMAHKPQGSTLGSDISATSQQQDPEEDQPSATDIAHNPLGLFSSDPTSLAEQRRSRQGKGSKGTRKLKKAIEKKKGAMDRVALIAWIKDSDEWKRTKQRFEERHESFDEARRLHYLLGEVVF